MTKTEKQVLPNPGLRGGEMLLLNSMNAKQAFYAVKRAQHTSAWLAAEAARITRITREAECIISPDYPLNA